MSDKESIFIDETKQRVMLHENINYVQANVIANEKYTLSGNLYFDKKETEKKVLLVVSFGDIILSKEESLKCGFSYSKKYGTYKYLIISQNNEFSLTFLVPHGAENMTLGVRSWLNEYNVYISSKLVLARRIVSLSDIEEIVRNSEEHFYSQLGPLIHMYSRERKSDYLVLTTRYPAYNDYYRNSFVHARVRGYIENGIHPEIFGMMGDNSVLDHYRFEEVHVTTGSGKSLNDLLIFHDYKNILVHFLNERMWNHLKKYIDYTKLYVWIHGVEIQPWYRRAFNYENEEELSKAKQKSEKRIEFWQMILKDPHPNMKLIFVSQYLADEVMQDLDIILPQGSYEIIHNYINTSLFMYEEKSEEQRKKILSIRSYASKKYANDLSVQAVLYIKEKYPEIFSDLEFTFIGDGVLFSTTLAPLKEFSNVRIERKFLKQKDIVKQHDDNGIFLTPTRWDSQGVSRDEAMSSGLVPITNRVTAIPEFVDDSCGILAEADDYIGLSEGIVKLYKNPELFLEMSVNSAQRVRKLSGYEQTVEKELNLMTNK